MSTRSCIIVKVRKEDIGKKKQFDEKILSHLEEWISRDCEGKVYLNEVDEEKSKPVTINGDYIGIYCHWDGYPSGVGNALKHSFNSYRDALNLVLGGDCSSIDENKVKHYANRSGEEWESVQPKQGKTKASIKRRYGWLEYAYLFDEERGGWLCQSISYGKNANKAGFKKF